MAKYTPSDYRIYLRNSVTGKNKHILVEGKDDKYLIERLCNDFLIKNGKDPFNHNKILVDSAESLIKEEAAEPESTSLNNRQKVESIVRSIINQPYANDFLGFVDRELYNFEWDYDSSVELQDHLNSHEVLERLVLSRGHSIENYVFEFSILCEALELISTTPYANQAINLFKETLEPVLRIACSVGLAATKAQLLSKSKSTIDYKLIEIISPTEVNFKIDEWIQKLIIDREIQQDKEQELKLHYDIYTEKVSKASISLVKWICHGHIGYEFVEALYHRCLVEVCPITQNGTTELNVGITWAAKQLFRSFINCWIKKVLEEKSEYPIAIFELLGIISK